MRWWWLVGVLALAGCKGDDVVMCEAPLDCLCGPTNPCPRGLVCDPITQICTRPGLTDAAPTDATHD